MHLVARATNNDLSDIIRDFKKFSAIKILNKLKKENAIQALNWLNVFSESTNSHSRNNVYQFWKYGSYPEEIYSPKFTAQKINYIHNNPVKAGMVLKPEDYYYSSAGDYAGRKGPVNVTVLPL